jgi:exo-poly-alpha-galacturonosidase
MDVRYILGVLLVETTLKQKSLIGRRTFISLAAAASPALALCSSSKASSLPAPQTQPNETAAAESPLSGLQLICPLAARTSSSIAVLWNKLAGAGAQSYDVHLDGKLVANTKFTDFTLTNLSAGKTYEISLRAKGEGSALVPSHTIRVATKPQLQVVDITTYGALGDGKTLNTKFIQAAIQACGVGGVVRIPKGVFLSGALYLKSDMTLLVEEGAVLLGSPNTRDYPLMQYRWEGLEKKCYASLINTPEANGARWHDITIMGPGTINANGSLLRKAELAEAAGPPGRAVCIRDTDSVYLYGVTVRQSPAWCVHLIYCSDVSVNGVSIHTKYDELGAKYAGIQNGDGLDPDSCRDVFIFDTHIASQDDCIALKSGRDAEGRAVGIPTENVRISRCRFTSGFGVAVGSEMAGGVRNVLVEDCVFEDTFSIASIKAPRGRGNVLENITYRDCTLSNKSTEHRDSKWFRGALYVDQFYGEEAADPSVAKKKDEGTSVIRNVLFQNITLNTVGGNAIYLAGLPESCLDNIRLDRVNATGEHGFIAYNLRRLTLNHVSVEALEGKAMQFVNVM